MAAALHPHKVAADQLGEYGLLLFTLSPHLCPQMDKAARRNVEALAALDHSQIKYDEVWEGVEL